MILVGEITGSVIVECRAQIHNTLYMYVPQRVWPGFEPRLLDPESDTGHHDRIIGRILYGGARSMGVWGGGGGGGVWGYFPPGNFEKSYFRKF